MKQWVSYKNGNYTVSLNLYTGTKIRQNNLDFFEPDTVESMDIKLTNKCDRQCKQCHESSTPFGKHGNILDVPFLEKLHPYCELALGGGNPLTHPDLDRFLELCQQRKHIPNMTVNQFHFEKDFDRIVNYIQKRLIFGIGISLVRLTPEFLEKVKKIPTAVIHVINGLVTEDQLRQLKDNGLKILVLGYKEFRKGKKLYEKHQDVIEAGKQKMKVLLPKIIEEGWFNVVSFDNLALKQLDVRSLMSSEEWNRFYMGDDGLDGLNNTTKSATFFVDLVKREFAINSCSDIRYPLMDTAEDMLNFLVNKKIN